MLRFVLVDDEALSIDNLQHALEKYDDIKIAGTFTRPDNCLNNIAKLKPHVLISDISMPDMDGIEFAQKVSELLPNIIIVFLTAYDTFALRSFEVGVFDYILKPFSDERIDKLVRRIFARYESMSSQGRETPDVKSNQLKNFITVNKSDSLLVVNKSEIIYCYAYNKKTYVYIKEGCYECKYTLEYLESMLDHKNFFRCHRSYIVNVRCIREIAPMFNQTYTIRLRDSRAEIPVSRNYAIKMKDFLGI